MAVKLCGVLSEMLDLRLGKVVEVWVEVSKVTGIVVVVVGDHVPAVHTGIKKRSDGLDTGYSGVYSGCGLVVVVII